MNTQGLIEFVSLDITEMHSKEKRNKIGSVSSLYPSKILYAQYLKKRQGLIYFIGGIHFAKVYTIYSIHLIFVPLRFLSFVCNQPDLVQRHSEEADRKVCHDA